MPTQHAAYADPVHDPVREQLETRFFARLLPRLLEEAGGGRMLDLGCGECLAAGLGGPRLTRYVGVDFREPAPGLHREYVRHDLREGLGPVGRKPYDLYLATFGVASHLRPAQLRRLLVDIATHARPGSLVALEALGLYSLEWPGRWDSAPGPRRALDYRLGSDVEVHPWSASELARLHQEAGIRPLRALDRSVQAGPKTGEGRYWPGIPPLRHALAALLDGQGGGPARAALAQGLPPLPASRAAAFHHAVAARRRRLVSPPEGGQATPTASPRVERQAPPAGSPCAAGRAAPTAPVGADAEPALARAVWALEPQSGGGWGHGLTVIGRVP